MIVDRTHLVKFAESDSAGNETFDVVTAVSGKRIRVLSYVLSVVGAQAVQFQSKGSGALVELSGNGIQAIASVNNTFAAAHNSAGWFETVAGEKLQIKSSASGAIGGHLSYVEY